MRPPVPVEAGATAGESVGLDPFGELRPVLLEIAGWADWLFFRLSTAITINAAISQSGICGFLPGPILRHWLSAWRKNGKAIVTNVARHVPSLARSAIVRTSSHGFLRPRTEAWPPGVLALASVYFADNLGDSFTIPNLRLVPKGSDAGILRCGLWPRRESFALGTMPRPRIPTCPQTLGCLRFSRNRFENHSTHRREALCSPPLPI